MALRDYLVQLQLTNFTCVFFSNKNFIYDKQYTVRIELLICMASSHSSHSHNLDG